MPADPRTTDSPEGAAHITRVEIIDHSPDGKGRVWSKRNLKNVVLSFQDEGRTLKVFVK